MCDFLEHRHCGCNVANSQTIQFPGGNIMKQFISMLIAALSLAYVAPAFARGSCYADCNTLCSSPNHSYRRCMRECLSYCPRYGMLNFASSASLQPNVEAAQCQSELDSVIASLIQSQQ